MTKKQLVTKAWGVTYSDGPKVMPWSIDTTRKLAIESARLGWTWKKCREYGMRAVKVTITQESP